MYTLQSAFEQPIRKAESSSTRKYDYSGSDQLLKRGDAVRELDNQKYKSNYEGDIAEAITAGRRIRALKQSMAGIAPVRVEAEKSDASHFDGGGSYRSVAVPEGSAKKPPKKQEDTEEKKET